MSDLADDNTDKPQEEKVDQTDSENPRESENQSSPESGKTEPPETKTSPPEQSKTSAEEPKRLSKSVSKELEKIIEQIEKLSVLELADLVHTLEDRFGVSAAAPAALAPSANSGQVAAGEPQEEQTTFNVILTSGGANKISVIKTVRELVPTLGLKEAKDLVEAAPKPVLEGVNKDTANEAKTKLIAAGGTVELQ